MAAADIARQVVSAGLGYQSPGWEVGVGDSWGRPNRLGHSHHHYHEEGSGVASRSRGKAGLLLPGSAAQSPLSPALPGDLWWREGGGRLAMPTGGQLNLHSGRKLQ